jgi:phosphate transport system permease protein
MGSTTVEREHVAGSADGHQAGNAISRPPSLVDRGLDRSFQGLTLLFAGLTLVLALYIVWEVGRKAMPAMQKYGLHFLTSAT